MYKYRQSIYLCKFIQNAYYLSIYVLVFSIMIWQWKLHMCLRPMTACILLSSVVRTNPTKSIPSPNKCGKQTNFLFFSLILFCNWIRVLVRHLFFINHTHTHTHTHIHLAGPMIPLLLPLNSIINMHPASPTPNL